MVADFFRKPLQGQLFKKLRDQIMGLAPINFLKDHVGNEKSTVTNNDNFEVSKLKFIESNEEPKRTYAGALKGSVSTG